MTTKNKLSLQPLVRAICILFAGLVAATAQAKPDTLQQARIVLDSLHQSAARADWDHYFSLYLPSAVFIGTDATEHWSMAEFEQYARPTEGWRYTPGSRQLVQVDKVIMFDELLDSSAYGICRGTGTLLLTAEGWKIAQYHLSFPIPNEMAKDITAQIKQAQSSRAR